MIFHQQYAHVSLADLSLDMKKMYKFLSLIFATMLAGCFDVVDPVAPASRTTTPVPTAQPVSANEAPLISGAPSTSAIVGRTWSFVPTASDPDGDNIGFTIENKPAWASFNAANGRLSGVPLLGTEGVYADIVIAVDDGTIKASLPGFDLTVTSTTINGAPVISGTPPDSVLVGQNYRFVPTASDANGDVVTFDIANLPPWASFSTITGILQGTPDENDAGNYPNIVITASDGEQSVSLPIFAINVQSANAANGIPQISGNPDLDVLAGEIYEFQVDATDPDGDALAFDIANLPEWAEFDATIGRLSGNPETAHIGRYDEITISVSDGEATSYLPSFSIVVGDPVANNSPQISGTPDPMVTVGSAYSFRPRASDSDGDEIVFEINNAPAWALFDASTGELSGTPQTNDIGFYESIVISVTDGELAAQLPSFTIVVAELPGNRPPSISGGAPATVAVGASYSFLPDISDPDNDPLSITVVNAPSWMAVDTSTGRLSGTPTSDDLGTTGAIVIEVDDGEFSVTLAPFSVTVIETPANQGPSISGAPPNSVNSNQTYTFQPDASDPDDDALTFDIANEPAWLAFDSDTGLLTGTPDIDDAGTYENIRISVSDGELTDRLPAFTITVQVPQSNQPPSISGTPASAVRVGQLYSFQPTATDAENDALRFEIDGQPGWLDFDTTTGRLSGTPQAGDAGTYSGIQISVNDAEFNVALPGFEIVVNQVATGSATLTWTPPTRNTDGSSLTDLDAYKIYYGNAPGNYTEEVRVENEGLTSYVIENLDAGIYYFVIRSVNSSGLESANSNEASKTID